MYHRQQSRSNRTEVYLHVDPSTVAKYNWLEMQMDREWSCTEMQMNKECNCHIYRVLYRDAKLTLSHGPAVSHVHKEMEPFDIQRWSSLHIQNWNSFTFRKSFQFHIAQFHYLKTNQSALITNWQKNLKRLPCIFCCLPSGQHVPASKKCVNTELQKLSRPTIKTYCRHHNSI